MDFDRIDINQCPKGEGNIGPNRFAGTARCKKESTECEPIHGWGYRRGGYQCRCRPQYRLPSIVRRPYLGEIIERASDEQYRDGFDCERVGWVQKVPILWERVPDYIRRKYVNRYYEYKNYSTAAHSLHTGKINIDQAIKFILGVNPKSCKNYHPQDLILNGDISFGAKEFFENEAKMATRKYIGSILSEHLQALIPF